MQDLVLSVSDFVAVFNQTLEYAYPSVVVQGEISNLRVSKNRWVYFDLKDETASVKFFGTVYQLPGPLEDGLLVQVSGQPRLHPLYGFSITVQFIQPVGEGSLKRAAALLEAKLAAEGLFEPARKRSPPYPPAKIGLITSAESAAYRDFVKILNNRWTGTDVYLADTQVQGEPAVSQIISALEYFNTHAEQVDVIVITRGGGSAEDMAVFNVEQVVRAVAGSRIPTLVAIGHEIDTCLAELAADVRASTPSNAAELLVPDKTSELKRLYESRRQLAMLTQQQLQSQHDWLQALLAGAGKNLRGKLRDTCMLLAGQRKVIEALNPTALLQRGYAVVRSGDKLVRSVSDVVSESDLDITIADGQIKAKVQ